jgi:hypothetical protein
MWIVEFLDEKVEALLETFPEDIQASFLRIVDLIESKRPGAGSRALCEAS